MMFIGQINVRALGIKFAKALTLSAAITGHHMMANASSNTLSHKDMDAPKPLKDNTISKGHVLSLRCIVDNKVIKLSKVSLIQVPQKSYKDDVDFGIATGHGLDTNADCYVQDYRGQRKRLKTISYAKNYKVGTNTDWALVSIERLDGEHITRYQLNDYLDDTQILDKVDIFFAQARGLPSNTQRCRLVSIDYKTTTTNSKKFITHNCKAIAGQSGSPITRLIEGRHKLTGIHLGHLWTPYSALTGKPAHSSYMRVFDKAMVDEILDKLTRLN